MKNVIFLLAAVALMAAGCSKDTNCRCQVTDVDEHKTVMSSEVVINVDGSVKCENITIVGDEWMAREGFNSSRNTVKCEAE
ncbi:MAG: hypothetical protein IJ620_02185 [Bacteroidales bacterium]|nr:hypothetical protein [Bacteroidales bacterium]